MKLDDATRICNMTARELEVAFANSGYHWCKIKTVNSHNILETHVAVNVTFKDDGSFEGGADLTCNIYVSVSGAVEF